MSTTPKTGLFAAVDGQAGVMNWSVSEANAVQNVVASNTRGGTARSNGVRDWTGSFQHLGGLPLAMPGKYIDFVGYTGPTDGTYGEAGDTFAGEAIVDSIAVTWDWTTNAVINTTVSFSGNGLMTITEAGDAVVDVTSPVISQIPEGIWPRYSLTLTDALATIAAALTKITNVATMTLTMTAANVTRVDSESAGWTGRAPGPIDWTVAIVQNNLQRQWAIKNQVLGLTLPITSSAYWGLRWGKVIDITGLAVDLTSGNILQQTVNVGMMAAHDVQGIGQIRVPGGVSDWWPAVAA